MKTPTIKCPECNGAGSVKIAEHLAETLRVMGRKKCTAAELSDFIPGVTVNAISNRLADLLALKLVTRTRQGKFLIYSRVPAKSDLVPARHS